MPTVPGSKQNVVPLPQAGPSEPDLMMALGEMRSQGRLPANSVPFDERFKGNVENRASMSPEELVAAENQSRKDRMLGYPELEAGIKQGALAKTVSPPSSLGRLAPAMAKVIGPERSKEPRRYWWEPDEDRESIGVSGGSR